MTAALFCRLLTTADFAAYKQMRLRACREEPVAFTESYEELCELPDDQLIRQLENSWVVGAFLGELLAGMGGLYRHKGIKVHHKGTVWGLYVVPEARGRKIARLLMEALLREARKANMELVHLSTDTSNPVSVGLYRAMGFEPWSVDKCFARLPGHVVDEVMMVYRLKDSV